MRSARGGIVEAMMAGIERAQREEQQAPSLGGRREAREGREGEGGEQEQQVILDIDQLVGSGEYSRRPNREGMRLRQAPGLQQTQTAIATTLFLTDDRVIPLNEVPFGGALVSRLFCCMLGVTKIRGPRPLLRLLATTCRYRACRPWVLSALVAVLTHDPSEFRNAIEQISTPDLEGTSENYPTGGKMNAITSSEVEQIVQLITPTSRSELSTGSKEG
jgi:hypothetical protein